MTYVLNYIDTTNHNENRLFHSYKKVIIFIHQLLMKNQVTYFDIHTGNGTIIEDLVMWYGEGGYWNNTLNDSSEKMKKRIESKRITKTAEEIRKIIEFSDKSM